jgi:hypothetical protein
MASGGNWLVVLPDERSTFPSVLEINSPLGESQEHDTCTTGDGKLPDLVVKHEAKLSSADGK